MEKNINILASFGDEYAQHMAASINSIFKHTEGNVHLHVIYSSLSKKNIELYQQWFENTNKHMISFYYINEEEYLFLPIRPGEHVNRNTYYRILAQKLLSNDIDKVLYVDCDTIVNEDVEPLINDTDLEGYALAAVMGGASAKRKALLGIKVDEPYFNAGVLLINLDYWRRNNVMETVLLYIRENPDYLLRWDQDALNAVLKGKWTCLDRKWNFGLDKKERYILRDCPAIMHFTGRDIWKPWYKNTWSQFQDFYLENLEGTPYESTKLRYFIPKNKVEILWMLKDCQLTGWKRECIEIIHQLIKKYFHFMVIALSLAFLFVKDGIIQSDLKHIFFTLSIGFIIGWLISKSIWKVLRYIYNKLLSNWKKRLHTLD